MTIIPFIKKRYSSNVAGFVQIQSDVHRQSNPRVNRHRQHRHVIMQVLVLIHGAPYNAKEFYSVLAQEVLTLLTTPMALKWVVHTCECRPGHRTLSGAADSAALTGCSIHPPYLPFYLCHSVLLRLGAQWRVDHLSINYYYYTTPRYD